MSTKNIKFPYSNLPLATYICIASICLFVTQGCNRENIKPIITKVVVDVTSTSAKTGGIINANNAGGPHGVCYNTTGNPTLDDNHTLDGYGPCEYITELTDLEPGTTYYVRAYCCSNTHYDGVTYGNEVTFTTVSVPTATELLTIPEGWKLSEAAISPSYQMPDGTIREDLVYIPGTDYNFFYSHEIDDIIHFSSDGSHYVNPGTLLATNGVGYTQETSLGQWHFDIPDNPSYLYMQIPFIYGAQSSPNTYDPAIEECRIISLTTDMLKISFTCNNVEQHIYYSGYYSGGKRHENSPKGTSYTITLTYVPAQ